MQSGIQFRGRTRIDLIQAFCDGIVLLPLQVIRNRFSVQFTSRNTESVGSHFRQAEEIVRQRYSSLHSPSITRVIPWRAVLGVSAAPYQKKR